jgi:hypothetical protein
LRRGREEGGEGRSEGEGGERRKGGWRRRNEEKGGDSLGMQSTREAY